ncbi:MAG: FHA domain-containing protein [Pirellulales bacterium]
MEQAARLARLGKHGQAEAELESALAIGRASKSLEALRDAHHANGEKYRQLNVQLHEALGREHWSEVVDAAEAMLQLSSESEPARDARRRAWQAVGTNLKETRVAPYQARRTAIEPAVAAVASSPLRDGNDHVGTDDDGDHADDVVVASLVAEPRIDRTDDSPVVTPRRDPTANQRRPAASGQQFLLWVDAVGGFWVCPDDRIVVGRPDRSRHADVPVLGDLARQHLIIHRAAEGYVVEPLAKTTLGGKLITAPTTLPDGSELVLNDTVRLRFSRPHALSGSARIDFISRHRTQPATDAVLLMSDSCVLGPGANCHVRCPDWPRDVILYRQGSQLRCRSAGPLEIDGNAVGNSGELTTGSHVAGEDFSLSLEPI